MGWRQGLQCKKRKSGSEGEEIVYEMVGNGDGALLMWIRWCRILNFNTGRISMAKLINWNLARSLLSKAVLKIFHSQF